MITIVETIITSFYISLAEISISWTPGQSRNREHLALLVVTMLILKARTSQPAMRWSSLLHAFRLTSTKRERLMTSAKRAHCFFFSSRESSGYEAGVGLNLPFAIYKSFAVVF